MGFDDIENIIATPVDVYKRMYGCGHVVIDRFVIAECFQKTTESIKRDFASRYAPDGYMLSQFKFAGIVCFWIRKLKPFSTDNSAYNRFINETLAFLVAYFFIFGYQKKSKKNDYHAPKITPNYLHDIIKSLRYNSHSPNSTAFIFESLCI